MSSTPGPYIPLFHQQPALALEGVGIQPQHTATVVNLEPLPSPIQSLPLPRRASASNEIENDLHWITIRRTQLNALTSELMNGIKPLPLLFLIQQFETTMRVKMDVANVNFEKWNAEIRNILYHFRMLINVSKLKGNKKRIRSSLGRLSATYINFVLKVLKEAETIRAPETCRRLAVDMYGFLKLMTIKEDGRNKPLQLVDLMLSSEELLLSCKHKGIAYYLMKTVLADRDFYAGNAQAYLKFLALVNVFRMNFTHTKKAIKDSLDDSKYRSPPASAILTRFKFFFKNVEDIDEEVVTSQDIFNRIIPNKIIRESKLACKVTALPKLKIKKIKKYLAKIRRKANCANKIGGRELLLASALGKSGSADSRMSFGKEQCSGRIKTCNETIDEIMTKGHEQGDVEDSSDTNEDNESRSGRSSISVLSNGTDELNPAVVLDAPSDGHTTSVNPPQGVESESDLELDDIILSDEEKTTPKSKSVLPLRNNKAALPTNFSTLDDTAGNQPAGDTESWIMAESEAKCLEELEENGEYETIEFLELDEEEVHDAEMKGVGDMEIGGEQDEELQEEEGGEFQEAEDKFSSGFPVIDISELESSADEMGPGSEISGRKTNNSDKEKSSPQETDKLLRFKVIGPGRVQIQEGPGDLLNESSAPSSHKKSEEDDVLQPLESQSQDKTGSSSTGKTKTGIEEGAEPMKTTVVFGPNPNEERILRSKVPVITPADKDERLNVGTGTDTDGGKVFPRKSVHRTPTKTSTKELETPSVTGGSPSQTQKKSGRPRRTEVVAEIKLSPSRQKRAISSSVLDTPAKRTRSAAKKLQEEVITVPEDNEASTKTRQSIRSKRIHQ